MGRRSALAAGTALGAGVLFVPAAHADTFTVDSLSDTDEVEGTLREEIEDANFEGGDDTIVFQSGLSGTITFEPGAQNIPISSDGLDIQGPGADQVTIDADGEDRIFRLSDFGGEGPGVDLGPHPDGWPMPTSATMWVERSTAPTATPTPPS